MFKHLLWVLCFALLPTLAHAAGFGPSPPLGPNQVLRGKFTQVHQLRLPSEPIRSNGHFVVAPQFGVIFSFEKPIPVTFTLTPLGMAQSVGGVPLYRVSAQKASFLGRIPTLLTAALSGNWKKLQPEFNLTHDGTASNWQVFITPKNPQQSRALFKALSASGSTFVDKAEVQRLDGLYDFFTFYDQSIKSSELTNEEIANFKRTVAIPAP